MRGEVTVSACWTVSCEMVRGWVRGEVTVSAGEMVGREKVRGWVRGEVTVWAGEMVGCEMVRGEVTVSAGEMVVRPGGPASSSAPSRVDVTERDHPLSLEPDSQWQAFFKDNDVLGQIDKDVRWAARV